MALDKGILEETFPTGSSWSVVFKAKYFSCKGKLNSGESQRIKNPIQIKYLSNRKSGRRSFNPK